MPITRRTWLGAALLVPVERFGLRRARAATRALDLIEAPNNLGLRPPRRGVEPGTWRAPAALDAAGLSKRLAPARHVKLERPRYRFDAVPGTRIRNGTALRAFSLTLADEVERSLHRGARPLVIGGDCSTMLGCLVGLRRAGGRGLIHVDGHSDFFHPGNYDATAVLGAAAGMDLALATGRGEATLTRWPELRGPLADDADTIQIGDRNGAYPDLARSAITRIPIAAVHDVGIAATVERAARRLRARRLTGAWLHIDLDVLDESVMPAVDAPGTPGLRYDELARLAGGLLQSGLVAGLDVSIYDPDLDPKGTHAAGIVTCVAEMLKMAP